MKSFSFSCFCHLLACREIISDDYVSDKKLSYPRFIQEDDTAYCVFRVSPGFSLHSRFMDVVISVSDLFGLDYKVFFEPDYITVSFTDKK